MKKLSKIMCYIGVGILCFGVYYLCMGSMSWKLAGVISFISGLILSYFINKKYKFMSSINKFIFSGIVIFLVDIILEVISSLESLIYFSILILSILFITKFKMFKLKNRGMIIMTILGIIILTMLLIWYL